MFAFFYSIILALFNGEWYLLDTSEALGLIQQELSHLGKAIGSLLSAFNIHTEALNSTQNIYSTLSMWNTAVEQAWNDVHVLELVGGVVAFVVCVGVVVAVVNIIKRIFTIFFQGVR